MLNLFAKLNITYKFMVFLLLIAVLPLAVAGYVSYQTAKSSLVDAALKDQEHILAGYKDNLLLVQGQLESLIANVSSVETINDVLTRPSDSISTYEQLALEAQVGYILNSFLNIKGLVSIHVMAESGGHFQVGDTLDKQIKPSIRGTIRQAAHAAKGQIAWLGVMENINAASRQHYVLVGAKAIFMSDPESGERIPAGVVLVNYSVKEMARLFDELGNIAKLYLIDDTNHFMYHPNPDYVGKVIDSQRLMRPSNNDRHRVVAVGTTRYYQTYQPIGYNNWFMLSEVSEATLLKTVDFIRNVSLIVFCIALFFIVLVSIYLSRYYVSPIQHITDSFKRLKSGDSKVTKLAVNGQDEMSQLAKWFNQFIDDIARRNSSERALRLSEERYELASKATNEGIWDINRDTGEVYFSDRFREIVGYQSDKAMASILSLHKMVHVDDRKVFVSRVKDFIRSASLSMSLEYRIKKPNNEVIFVKNNCRVERNQNNEIERIAGSIQDVSLQKEIEGKLRHDAAHDSLTGLYNRSWMLKRIDRELEECGMHSDREFAVLFIDLDDFKQINDTLGHSVGDLLLIEVAKRIESCVRPGDSIARLGGDEFIIFLADITTSFVLQVAERLVQRTSEPYRLYHHQHETSFSIGVAFSSSGYISAEEILRDADTAMYSAKALGKGSFEIFDNEMREMLLERTSNEKDLNNALALNQFEMYYQPIVALETDKVIGFESLIRWNHPDRVITPDVFIPLAEENNYIQVLGRWIFEEVVKQINAWEKQFDLPERFKVAVNISPKQFSDRKLIQDMQSVIENFNIETNHLTVELTETAIVQDQRAVLESLQELKKRGVNIHLDDFGTGFSSLTYLNEFPISAIKIDRSFVCKINSNDRDARMVDTLLLMARELGLEVVAEGVEEQDQYDYLQARKCHYAQGYFIDRPLQVDQATAVLEKYYSNT